MEGDVGATYSELVDSFRSLAACEKCWDCTHEKALDRVADRTQAGRSVSRSEVALVCDGAEVLATSKLVMRFPNANGGDLFIYPGLVLVCGGRDDFALIKLSEVRLNQTRVEFLEEEVVPLDSKQVGTTWLKANKDGSQDRRFAYNPQIPIVEYGRLRFQSASGLDEEYQFSSPGKAERFKIALAKHQNALPA